MMNAKACAVFNEAKEAEMMAYQSDPNRDEWLYAAAIISIAVLGCLIVGLLYMNGAIG
jgi:hypothetical protein